ETLQIGNLTIHFEGGNATEIKAAFDSAYAGSSSFQSAMTETARTFKDIYVGGSLTDLQGQPGYASAGFDPNSAMVRDAAAFGKAAGADTYFMVVTGQDHTLVQDGQSFAGSTQMAMVHEFLHPTQIIR